MTKNIEHIEALLAEVPDPEIPVLSVLDLGVVRDVKLQDKEVIVRITPTYSGCPAMDTIAADIRQKLEEAGYHPRVELVLSPAWTTDWISDAGRAKLEAYGIAAPLEESGDKKALLGQSQVVACTRCGSKNTKLLSEFGSTACKALFQCRDCGEPFDYFKCLK